MISTYMSYQLLTRDIDQSLHRIKSQPMVQRETEYYRENITKVTSIDEFIGDSRLFRYAMKAHGLEDMAYAKAFMRKVLEEGITDPNSFANKLTDRRYLEFARTFDFVTHGELTTVFNPAQQGTVQKFIKEAADHGIDPANPTLQEQTAYYLQNVTSVRSIDDFLNDDGIYVFAMLAHGFAADELPAKSYVRQILEGGIDDPESLANKEEDERFLALAESFNFARHGEKATTINPTQQPAIDKFLRQTLEENAGAQNEGVRLALYFERMAPKVTSHFGILGDRALATVVRTILGLPDAVAQLDIDKQAAMLKSRLDIEDLKDPKKLGELINRFTTMWEINNPSSPQHSSVAALFGQPPQIGLSADVLMTIARMKV